jgi:hypothetical protein
MENTTLKTPLQNKSEARDTLFVRLLGGLAIVFALLFPISRFIANASAAAGDELEPGAIAFIIVIALLGIGYGLLFVIRGLKISPKTIFILDTISLIAWILFIYIFLVALLLAGIFGGAFVAIMNHPLTSASSASSASSSASSSAAANNPVFDIGSRFADAMVTFTFFGIARLVFAGICAFKKEPAKGLYMALMILTILCVLILIGGQIVTGLDKIGSLHPMMACEIALLGADYFVLKNKKIPDEIPMDQNETN